MAADPRSSPEVWVVVADHLEIVASVHDEIARAFRALPAAAREAVERLASFGIHPAGQR